MISVSPIRPLDEPLHALRQIGLAKRIEEIPNRSENYRDGREALLTINDLESFAGPREDHNGPNEIVIVALNDYIIPEILQLLRTPRIWSLEPRDRVVVAAQQLFDRPVVALNLH